MTGEQVREGRRGRGWTQERLASALGVSVATVQSWEQGRRGVPQMAERLMRRLGLRWTLDT